MKAVQFSTTQNIKNRYETTFSMEAILILSWEIEVFGFRLFRITILSVVFWISTNYDVSTTIDTWYIGADCQIGDN